MNGVAASPEKELPITSSTGFSVLDGILEEGEILDPNEDSEAKATTTDQDISRPNNDTIFPKSQLGKKRYNRRTMPNKNDSGLADGKKINTRASSRKC